MRWARLATDRPASGRSAVSRLGVGEGGAAAREPADDLAVGAHAHAAAVAVSTEYTGAHLSSPLGSVITILSSPAEPSKQVMPSVMQ
eukprot:CAMPEP_0180133742 /NCGR_PEP_ID=MMETSP0986-20121125/9718_1 /TAXON_ID=697907 /ORGANISM="non described non described, Strain CCMP2293" /LENGTH=86 /DNA_ID=CAMNT_0022073911 /DNA_START=233 /DNA_END=494 /DNA_ORIENTATION=+